MKVLIDARSIGPKLSGLGRHTLNLILGLSYIESELEFYVLYNSPRAYKVIDKAGGPFRNRFHWIPTSSVPNSVLSNFIIPWVIRMYRIQLFHDVTGSGVWAPGVRRITTLHELDGLHSQNVDVYREKMKKKLKGTDLIISVSHSLAQEIDQQLYISFPKIRIIPNGIDPWYVDRATSEELRAMRERFKIPGKYFLCVSVGNRKSKNTEFLTSVAETWNGDESWVFTLPKRSTKNEKNVFLDIVDDIWLRPLYAEAAAVVVPSTYEGFSIPPIEALATGTLPVVSSIASHREFLSAVLPDSLFFDPDDPQSLAAALQAVTNGGEPLRESVLEKFRAVRDHFSFVETAKRVHATYREALRTLI